MGDTLDALWRDGETVFESPYFKSVQIPRGSLVIVVRTALPFDSLMAAEDAFAGVIKSYPYIREHWNLLTDLRESPMRTDPAFERVIYRFRPEMVRAFASHAILVKTAVGSLQVSRHSTETKTETLVTQSASTALKFLGITGAVTQPPDLDKV